MKALKYGLPILFSSTLVVFAYWDMLFCQFLFTLGLRVLHYSKRDYTEEELRKELHFFETAPSTQRMKLINVGALLAINIWALWFLFSPTAKCGQYRVAHSGHDDHQWLLWTYFGART